MKPTIRVSIGGLAFSLEEDAYRILDNYLKSLRRHFESNPEADEIIADIEIRLSELLEMRMKETGSAVSETDAQEVIKTMGNPKDFDDSRENIEEESAPRKESGEYTFKSESQDFSKKLYRDEDNKIIGGVFSGLGHYFNIDPTILRIAIVGLILLLNFLSFKGAGTIVIAYIVLWIVMPVAKTFSQKLSMTGADPSIVNIEDRSQSASLKRKSNVGACLRVLINIVTIFFIVIMLIVVVSIVAVLLWLYFDTEIAPFSNYLLLFGFNTINFKIAIFLAVLLPLFGLLALMFKIIRRTPFTRQTLVSFSIGLIFWFGSAFYLSNHSFRFVKNHREVATVTETLPMDSITSDTLRIKLMGDTGAVYTQPDNEYMLYRGDEMKYRQVQILPKITVKVDSTITDYKIEVRKKAYADEVYKAENKAENMHLNYTRSGGLINIDPEWYDNKHPWNLQTYEMIVTAPPGKKVIVDKPLRDKYKANASFSINSRTFRRYDYNYRRHYYFD